MHTYKHTHTYIYIYVYIYIYLCIYIYMYLYVDLEFFLFVASPGGCGEDLGQLIGKGFVFANYILSSRMI